jgi:penicillin amidase
LLSGDEWDEAMGEAIERALVRLRETLGDDPSAWAWRRLHATKTVHPLSRTLQDAAGELDPPSVSMGGDGDCVQAGSAEVGVWIEHSSVARYVFDTSDWDNSAWIVPLGSSGHPSSPHYADQATDWAALRLRPMLYSAERVDADARTRQVLEPR